MSPARRNSGFLVLAILVTLVSGGMSFVLGGAASMLYDSSWQQQFNPHDQGDSYQEQPVQAVNVSAFGSAWGAALGVVAGITWSSRMFRAPSLAKGGSLVLRSLGWGTALGAAAGILLHVGLGVITGKPPNIGTALLFGLPAGCVLGLAGGVAAAGIRWHGVRIDRLGGPTPLEAAGPPEVAPRDSAAGEESQAE